jgi:hypothetical protein
MGIMYDTIRLPKDVDSTLLNSLATKFRAFKLHALQVAPEAFPAQLIANLGFHNRHGLAELPNQSRQS